MINSRKKGFTLVELVIVIAVVAILAAVLIPTFSSLIRKANISSDTVVAKNLNTALSIYDAENDVKEFDDVLKGIKEHGYLIANLNAKTDGCFFVWEKDTNQILLVDSKEEYKVLFSVKDGYGEIDNSWYFAISNKEVAAQISADLNATGAFIKNTISSSDNLKEAINAGGEFYIDESVVLSKNSLLTFNNNSTSVVNLGNSSLNTSGILREDGEGIIPVEVKQGNVTFNGGVISTGGENLNYHGLKVSYALQTSSGTDTTFNGTKFDLSSFESQIRIFGKSVMNDVVIEGSKSGVETRYNGDLTLNNVTINSDGGSSWYGACIWSCSFNSKAEDGKASDHNGTATITINSGKYTSKNCNQGYTNVVACGGKVVINGGEFTSPVGKMFSIHANGQIEISGGTFNGYTFAQLLTWSSSDWAKLCNGCTVTVVNGKIIIK